MARDVRGVRLALENRAKSEQVWQACAGAESFPS